jgi:uncharacterized protein (TIGR03083 family)
MAGELDYLGHITSESTRFAAALRDTDPGTPVPTCPDWRADDLLWHLTEVQWFWGTIVRERLTADDEVEALDIGNRPTDRRALFAFYDRVGADLVDELRRNAPDTEVWTWSDDHSVGFIRRRQAHEALIHRVDAELTAGQRTPISSHLASDGVDEVLRVMYGGVPPWGEYTPNPSQTLRVRTTDTDVTWLLTIGRFLGTDPRSGEVVDDADLRVADVDDGRECSATISGSAGDLVCWLWNRPAVGEVERAGDVATLDALDAMRSHGIN